MEASSGDLVVVNSAASAITQYAIAADGALTAVVSRSASSADSSPAALIVDKNGRSVLSISKDAVPNLAHLAAQ
ncbi:MAG: hypothetical protein WCE63_18970 [Acidobacteriaceae bacterium]